MEIFKTKKPKQTKAPKLNPIILLKETLIIRWSKVRMINRLSLRTKIKSSFKTSQHPL